MGKAGAQIEISAGTSRLASGLTAAKRAFMSWGTATARGIGAAFKGVNKLLQPGDTMKNALGHVGGGLMTKGLDSIVGAADEVRNFERNLMRFQIATDGASGSVGDMRKTIADISRDTGVAREEVLAGAQAYVGFTGDAKGAAAASKLFADVSVATGASVSDVAQAMASLKTSMGITADQGEAAFSALIVQGKGGAVEIKDMAGELASLAPQFALFKGGKGVEGLREMGAGFQVIMKNAATASDAATKYSALMGSLSDKETLKALKGMGVQVTDNKGKLLDASTVFENIAKNQKLFSGTNLSSVFGRKEAQLAALALREHIGTYRELRDAASDTAAVQRDKMTMLDSDAGRLDKAFNAMKLTIAEAFTPERIRGFVNAVEGLAEKLGPVMESVGKIGEVLGGFAGVGKSIRGAIGGNAMRSKFLVQQDKFMAGEGLNQLDMKMREGRFSAMQIAGAKSRLRDDEARAAAIKRIMGAEVGDRTSKESIRQAVLASQGAGLEYGQGKIGAMTTGEQYLRAAGVTKEEQTKIQNEMFLEAVKGIPDAIRLGMQQRAEGSDFQLQIGDNQIARATDQATNARRG